MTLKVAVARDWEEKVSQFLQKVIENPEAEPNVCESLINYIIHLVQEDRRVFREKVLARVGQILEDENKAYNPKILIDAVPEEYR